VFGVFAPLVLIVEMGIFPILFSLSLIALGTVWYLAYARSRVIRSGAIYHLFARLGEQRYAGLDTELRNILKEKGVREEDSFDEVVARAEVIDLPDFSTFEDIVQQASNALGPKVQTLPETLARDFLEGSRIGATPVSHGAVLPHTRIAGLAQSELVLVRCREGRYVEVPGPSGGLTRTGPVHAFFFIVSPNENPGQHLRILAQIAGRVDESNFLEEWLAAADDQELKENLLRDERFLSIKLKASTASSALVGRTLREVAMPEGCLVALIRRGSETLVPQGNTTLHENDRLTLIGDAKGIRRLQDQYVNGSPAIS
jgi:mannitol/fructose-specific phosphotransferase system IIA component (Ntr-type)